MEVWKLMAPSGESGQEELEASTEIMEERETSLQDTVKEEMEASADIMEEREASLQDTDQEEIEVAADIIEGSSQDQKQ
ncbi:unnamed protein product [Eruca vesicaria subsp. sativa]|uniref:Uncharacterized protein n=1 Tax=Eruca vesicaria subsp. sativa TaxID=29727 RepID=A0ABC8IU15_ERUVS|nr:unnamed protein product [Eruca vesicaria subsp. sativa]